MLSSVALRSENTKALTFENDQDDDEDPEKEEGGLSVEVDSSEREGERGTEEVDVPKIAKIVDSGVFRVLQLENGVYNVYV